MEYDTVEEMREAIRNRLIARGAKVIPNPYHHTRIFACYPHNGIGIFVVVEAKLPNTNISSQVQVEIQAWRKGGAIAFISADPDSIVDLIDENIRVRMTTDRKKTRSLGDLIRGVM